ncbi:hypothetical protein [Arthrobacter sp. KNU40]
MDSEQVLEDLRQQALIGRRVEYNKLRVELASLYAASVLVKL